MSSHLIQTIELTDWFDEESLGLQCIKHGNTTPKWRTVSTLLSTEFENYTSLVGSEDGDKWVKNNVSKFAPGGVKFGTSCLKTATLRVYCPKITEIVLDSGPFEIDFYVDLYINEVQITPLGEIGFILATVNVDDPAQTVDYTVDLVALGLECRPCGNIWKIFFGYNTAALDVLATDGQMTMEIVDVTF